MTSEEDTKMLALFKSLGVPPMKDAEELKKYMTEFGGITTTKIKTQLNVPRISTFFGEKDKGEVSYPTWVYEVMSLREEHIYPDELLLQAIRRSLKGHAADQLRHLGLKPTIDDILFNFESTYGVVETAETILKKFYACKQLPGESVLNYCIRLEDIHARAVEMKVLGEVDGMLKRVFFRGLTPQLRHLSNYKFETILEYTPFKREVRQIENEIEDDKDDEKVEVKTRCQAVNKKEEKMEKSKIDQQFNQLVTMMGKMNDRMDIFEKNLPTQCVEQNTPAEQPPTAFQQVPKQQTQNYPQQSHYYDHQSNDPRQGQQSHYYDHQSNDPRQFQPNPYASQYQSQDQPYFSPQQQQSYRPVGWRGQKHYRGSRGYRPRGQGPYRGQGRGDNSYRTVRPLAGTTFQPECYACHERGHMARDCPLNM